MIDFAIAVTDDRTPRGNDASAPVARSGLRIRHHDVLPDDGTVVRDLDCPLGRLTLIGDGERLRHLELPAPKRPLAVEPSWRRSTHAYSDAVAQLDRYFAGELRAFDLELDLVGTGFQRRIWSLLAAIPYGETTSYGGLARAAGNAAASRAVGAANGQNPIPIVLPCHRVIGSDGSLTGFGGGLDAKRFLLELEGVELAGAGAQSALF